MPACTMPEISSSPVLREMNSYLSSKFYRATREVQKNTILNRATIEILGADLPTALTEAIGRNWKSGIESGFRITWYLINSMIVPLLFIPFLNKIAKSKFDLPKCFNKTFYNQFEDLLPEKNTEDGNKEFVKKLTKLEREGKVKEFLGDKKEEYDKKILSFKDKLLKAKTFVMKFDVLFAGLLTYFVPWTTNWFSKRILGVTGFTGELDLLDDSQREESTQFHEKTKYLKFGFGLLPTIFGSFWYSDKVYKAATVPESEINNSKLLPFIKKNIKQFDYYKEIYSNKLNLAGTFLFGGDFGFLLAARSLNEFIERTLRLAVFWPTMFFGVEWVNFKLSERHDKKYGTKIVDYDSPKEMGIRQVKTLTQLEDELKQAELEEDESKIKLISETIKAQAKNYWLSILLDSAAMGVGLTSANIIGTKIRVEKFGIY